jgi:hypothetical protein
MIINKFTKITILLLISTFGLNSCGNEGTSKKKKKILYDPKERVKKNLEEGRGFRLNKSLNNLKNGGGNFEFASSNELWRASLDSIDFMPLASVNYSGGIIVTDWYSTDQKSNESIKISIRFLSNEVRADALDIKVFNRKCVAQSNCVVSEKIGNLIPELKRNILQTATIYQKQKKDKNFKPYVSSNSR